MTEECRQDEFCCCDSHVEQYFKDQGGKCLNDWFNCWCEDCCNTRVAETNEAFNP